MGGGGGSDREGGRVGGVRVDVNEELKFLRKLRKYTKKKSGGGGGGGRVGGEGVRVGGCSGWGDQGGCERRIEVFVKIQKKMGGGVGSGGVGGGEGRVGGSGWMCTKN